MSEEGGYTEASAPEEAPFLCVVCVNFLFGSACLSPLLRDTGGK